MAKASSDGVSVIRVDLDASTSTAADVQEAQWRAGVNRQAQPGAISHQKAASQAAAAKRKAKAMSGAEKEAADRRNADRRNEAKRAKRATTASTTTVPAAVPSDTVLAAAWPTAGAALSNPVLAAVSLSHKPSMFVYDINGAMLAAAAPISSHAVAPTVNTASVPVLAAAVPSDTPAVAPTVTIEATASPPASPEPPAFTMTSDIYDDPLMDSNYMGCLGAVAHDVPTGGFHCGQQVHIHDLVRRPDLNGQLATLKVWHDACDPERWDVELASGERILIKTFNLRPAPAKPPSPSPPKVPHVNLRLQPIEFSRNMKVLITMWPEPQLLNKCVCIHQDGALNGTRGVAKSFRDGKYKVVCVDEDGDEFSCRVRSKFLKVVDSPKQAPSRKLWQGMPIRSMRTCSNPPPPVPCSQLPALHSTLPDGFHAFNETNHNYFDLGMPEWEARAAGHTIPVVTVYCHIRTGRRSLFPPSTADGHPRGYVPIPHFSEVRGNHRYMDCGDPACAVCPMKV